MLAEARLQRLIGGPDIEDQCTHTTDLLAVLESTCLSCDFSFVFSPEPNEALTTCRPDEAEDITETMAWGLDTTSYSEAYVMVGVDGEWTPQYPATVSGDYLTFYLDRSAESEPDADPTEAQVDYGFIQLY